MAWANMVCFYNFTFIFFIYSPVSKTHNSQISNTLHFPISPTATSQISPLSVHSPPISTFVWLSSPRSSEEPRT
ncbi:hypothetical protein M5689_012537 [Euphorbia peplus]|nr:hypothetical protein M5689_012537 [Euphorbia peplus]